VSELFPEAVVTERLHLVRETDEYVDLRERYESLADDALSDEEVQHAGFRPFEHLGDAREYVDVREAHWDDGNGVVYAIRPRDGEQGGGEAPRASDGRAVDDEESGDLAGEAELSMDWGERRGVISCYLREPYWGRGYSGERAAALLALAFERFDLDVVVTAHAVENENSRRAVEKYVERFGGERDGGIRNWGRLDGEPVDLVQYSITREDYDESGERPTVEFVDGRDDRRKSR
jgi:RimJ/RimL family protein N-acetyltransferase